MADDIRETRDTQITPNIQIDVTDSMLKVKGGPVTDTEVERPTKKFVMNVDGRTIGEATIVLPPHKDQNVYNIYKLSIKQAERGKGYGEKLLEAVEQWALTQNPKIGGAAMATVIQPDDPNDKERLRQFYISRGYKPSTIKPDVLTKFIFSG